MPWIVAVARCELRMMQWRGAVAGCELRMATVEKYALPELGAAAAPMPAKKPIRVCVLTFMN